MKVDSNLALSWGEIPKVIRELELLGYDGVSTSELSHDPSFLSLISRCGALRENGVIHQYRSGFRPQSS